MMDVTYRNVRPEDFDALHRLMSDWNVVRQLGGWPWPPDPAFTRLRANPYGGDGFLWAICIQDHLCGTVGVTGGDLGYVLSPNLHGRGIVSMAARKAVDHAFVTTQRGYITASTWGDNAASYHVLQKLGFFHWQTRYLRAKARRRPTLVHHQRLERKVWERLRTAAQ